MKSELILNLFFFAPSADILERPKIFFSLLVIFVEADFLNLRFPLVGRERERVLCVKPIEFKVEDQIIKEIFRFISLFNLIVGIKEVSYIFSIRSFISQRFD